MERRYLPEGEIESFFAATSLAVLPYTEASQTGVGSAAVGYGVPVVATRVGGLPDLALDETYLADPGNDAALARAILRHIDDDGYIRARVLAEVAAPRSWDSTAARSIEIYEQIQSSGRGVGSVDRSRWAPRTKRPRVQHSAEAGVDEG
jgi:glycosyltransferase involved in cell wall biosynthesis